MLVASAAALTIVVFLIVVCRFLGFGEFDGPPVFSPDGRFAITVTESNCGAPCSFNATAILKDGQNGDGHVTTLVTGNIHPCTMIFKWNGFRELTVEYEAKDVDLGPTSWHGVTITYEQVDLPSSVWAAAWNVPDFNSCYNTYYHD